MPAGKMGGVVDVQVLSARVQFWLVSWDAHTALL